MTEEKTVGEKNPKVPGNVNNTIVLANVSSLGDMKTNNVSARINLTINHHALNVTYLSLGGPGMWSYFV